MFTERLPAICWAFLLFSTACGKTESGSPPASVWTKQPTNPVLRKGQPYGFDFFTISDPCVLWHEGIFKMWYTAGGAVPPDTVLHASIGYATSTNGIDWQKQTGPVLDIDKNGWDSLGIETASVLIDSAAPPSSRYKMWYAGQTSNAPVYYIGYATSADGIHWVRRPQPVLHTASAQDWDNGFLEGPAVLKVGGEYKMWYAAYDGVVNGQPTDGKVSIGLATSTDGINWSRHQANPVLNVGDGWEAQTVQDPHVLFLKNHYHMWYGGTNDADAYGQQTGYAVSADGINWKKSVRNPVLQRGAAGAWDANTASFPSVLLRHDSLYLWYTGKDVHPLPAWPQPYFWEVGLAKKKVGDREELE